MAFIGLGKIDKRLIPIIIGSIFSILTRLLVKFKGTKLFEHKIIPNLLSVFSYTFSLIPLVILKIKTKGNLHNESNISSNSDYLIYTDNYSIQTQGKIGYIFLTSLFSFFQGILLIYSIEIKSNSWIWFILMVTLFYYIIFRIILYKHHYLSIVLIILTGIIIDLAFENLQYDISHNLILFCLRFFREIAISFREVVNKYLIEKKYCSVYELSFFMGLINLILFGIFSLLNYYYLKIDDFAEYINNFNRTELLAIIGFVIIQFGLNLSYLFTNKENTPCHIFIISVLGQFANLADFSTYSIVIIFFLIFLLFMSLIFTEIIEINICGLSYNTNRNITNRAKIVDLNLMKENTVSSLNLHEENDEKNKSNNDSGRNTLENNNDNV